MVLFLDTVILGRQGGPSTTSIAEALLRSVRRSSALLHRQVVRPRRRRSDRRIRSFAGSMLLSNLASYLDGNVWRSPASGGGDSQGPDCFPRFCPRVFFVMFEDLSSNSWFLCAIDARGPLCKMYLPRVI
jgi:hypothetical protein